MAFRRLNNLKPSKSGNQFIYEMHYDDDEQTLRIKFTTGDIEDHLLVPPDVVQALIDGESLQKSYWALIRKGGYESRKVGKD